MGWFNAVVHTVNDVSHHTPKLFNDATSTTAASRGLHATHELIVDTADVASKNTEKVTSSEVRAAARDISETTNASVAKAKNKWKSTMAKNGPAYIAAGSAAYGVYATNQRIGQLGSAFVNAASTTDGRIKALEESMKDGAASLANHMPASSDVNDMAKHAMDGAHNVGTHLEAALPSFLTIGTIMVGFIVAYEAYRFMR